MACFLVPVAEAVVVTAVSKTLKTEEAETVIADAGIDCAGGKPVNKIPFRHKLKWLTNMLWGGSALLAFEHVWHGEVVPWFPFLTAAGDPAEMSAVFEEMATVGVAMALLITGAWGIMLLVANAMEKRECEAQAQSE